MAGRPTQATLMDHVVELRWRLLKVVGVFFVGGAIGYLIREPIIILLQRPLGEQLYFTSPTGSFEFIMRVCALVGVVIALPMLIYQLLRFIEPALTKPLPRRLIASVVVGSYLLAIGGMAFSYMAGLPTALHFFTTIGTEHLKPLISINEYFRFVMSYLVIFAIAFQLPLLLLLFNHISPLDPPKLRKARKWVIVGSFCIGLLMPMVPDPITQALLAAPIIILYEFSVLMVVVANWRTRRRAKATAPVPAATQPAPAHRPAARPMQRRPAPLYAMQAPRPGQPRRPLRQPADRPQPLPQPLPTAPSPSPAVMPSPRPALRDAIDLREWAMQPVHQNSYNIIDLRPNP
jgi:sec-independent protein translocase protein TatC